MIKIVVTGARGRMGRRIVALAKETGDLEIAGEVDVGDRLGAVIAGADAVVDFSTAEAAGQNARAAAGHGKPIVIGTTGLDASQEALVRKAAGKVAVVYAPNMSVGVNVMWRMARTASRALGRGYSVDISETHHAHKADRPSGTAIRLIEMVVPEHPGGIAHISDDETWSRRAGDERISCRSIRRGEVVGDHTVRFSTPFETVEITHSAHTRDVFAQGALTAARWVVGKAPGLYGMDDVLNLR